MSASVQTAALGWTVLDSHFEAKIWHFVQTFSMIKLFSA